MLGLSVNASQVPDVLLIVIVIQESQDIFLLMNCDSGVGVHGGNLCSRSV